MRGYLTITCRMQIVHCVPNIVLWKIIDFPFYGRRSTRPGPCQNMHRFSYFFRLCHQLNLLDFLVSGYDEMGKPVGVVLIRKVLSWVQDYCQFIASSHPSESFVLVLCMTMLSAGFRGLGSVCIMAFFGILFGEGGFFFISNDVEVPMVFDSGEEHFFLLFFSPQSSTARNFFFAFFFFCFGCNIIGCSSNSPKIQFTLMAFAPVEKLISGSNSSNL